jgi:BRO family, N-terminal domain
MNFIFFEKNKIKILDNKICLRDLITQTKNGRSSKKIIDSAKIKTYDTDGHGYIDLNTTVKILDQFDTKQAEKLKKDLEKQKGYKDMNLVSDDESESEALVVANNNQNLEPKNEFSLFGFKFTYVIGYEEVNGKVKEVFYLFAKEVAEFLEYIKTDQAVRIHVSDKYKKTLEGIIESWKLNPLESRGFEFNNSNFKGNYKSSIFITKHGLIQLVMSSNKPEAIHFQDIVIEEIIPNVMDTGYYCSQDSLMINFDTSIVNEEIPIEKFDGYNVVYMIVLGLYKGGVLVKFGHTKDLKERIKVHKNTYKPQFTPEGWESSIKLIYVAITDNNKVVDDAFKQFLKMKGLNAELEFDGATRVELFTTNNLFTLDKAKYEMTRIIKENKSKVELEKDKQMEDFEEKYNITLAIEQERTTQCRIEANKEIQIKKMEIDKEKDIQIKKIEAERDIKIKHEEEETKREQEKTEQLRLKRSAKEEPKAQPKVEPKKNIYEQFLDECTEESATHIHCLTLYDKFKVWFQEKNQKQKIPNYKIFYQNMEKNYIVKKVKVEGKSQNGIQHLNILD